MGIKRGEKKRRKKGEKDENRRIRKLKKKTGERIKTDGCVVFERDS
jgi:hypothetical protein